MAFLHYDNVRIAALAGAVPEFSQTINLDPAHPRAAYNANFVKQTGIRQRHISITEQTATDTGYIAVQAALKKAGWEVSSIDGLVFLTQTPDFNIATGNAFILQNHLGLPERTLVMDIAQGCAAFPYGLATCAAFLQQPDIKRMVMVVGDCMWPIYPGRDSLLEAATFLTGDGAAAVLLERPENATSIDIELLSDGSGYHFLYNPWDGSRNAWNRRPGTLPNGQPYYGGGYMDGMEITAFSTIRVADDIRDFLARLNKTVDDYDGVVLHQANLQILKAMRRRLKIAPEKFPVIIDKLANTNGASVLLAMIDAYSGKSGIFKLLASAFGIGLSWGITSFDIDASGIVPLIYTSHKFEEDVLAPLADN